MSDREIEFLRSCVVTADSERDYFRDRYEALCEIIAERAGQAVLEAWLVQLSSERAIAAELMSMSRAPDDIFPI